MMRSTNVTKDAINKTNIGILTSFLMWLRNNETLKLEATRTKVVASPKVIALTTLLVTAKSGHKPSNATNAWLFFHRPFPIIFLYSCITRLLYQFAGFTMR